MSSSFGGFTSSASTSASSTSLPVPLAPVAEKVATGKGKGKGKGKAPAAAGDKPKAERKKRETKPKAPVVANADGTTPVPKEKKTRVVKPKVLGPDGLPIKKERKKAAPKVVVAPADGVVVEKKKRQSKKRARTTDGESTAAGASIDTPTPVAPTTGGKRSKKVPRAPTFKAQVTTFTNEMNKKNKKILNPFNLHNSYMLFYGKRRPELLAQDVARGVITIKGDNKPAFGALSKRIAGEWKSMSKAEREPYQVESDAMREAKRAELGPLAKPDGPRSGYMLFSDELKIKIVGKGPAGKGDLHQFTQQVADAWNLMSESEKKIYQDRGVLDKARSVVDFENWTSHAKERCNLLQAATDAETKVKKEKRDGENKARKVIRDAAKADKKALETTAVVA